MKTTMVVKRIFSMADPAEVATLFLRNVKTIVVVGVGVVEAIAALQLDAGIPKAKR